MCAARSTVHLSDTDAAIIKGMIARGDKQHDIASWFGQNGGRVGEISTGDEFSGVVAATADLPPIGPYIFSGTMDGDKSALERAREQLLTSVAWLDEQIAKS
jgi:hypothetical protein